MTVLWDLVNSRNLDPFGSGMRGYQQGRGIAQDREKRSVLAELASQPNMDYDQAAQRLLAVDPNTASTLAQLGMRKDDQSYRRETRAEDMDWRRQQAEQAQRQWQATHGLQRQILEQGRLPTGFQRSPEGGLSPLPGGPADPNYIAQTNQANGKMSLTPAQMAVDKEYGKDYTEFVAGGGFADAQKNIAQLRGVVNQLKSGNQNLTGPMLGRAPDWLKQLSGNDAAIQTRETVEEVVQRNLRIVLGAQFTEREGERLISRAFNPNLSEAENAQRLDRLITAMERAVEAKMAAAQYYEKNGTLQGFRGNVTVRPFDLERAIEGGGQRSQPAPMSVDQNKDQSQAPQGGGYRILGVE